MGERLENLPDWPRGMPAELAARYIGASVSTLYVLVDTGELAATWITPGRKVYLREHLDSFLDRKAKGAGAAVEPEANLPDWQRALIENGQRLASVR